jgi:hypothetical protein
VLQVELASLVVVSRLQVSLAAAAVAAVNLAAAAAAAVQPVPLDVLETIKELAAAAAADRLTLEGH